MLQPGPLHGFYERTKTRCGHGKAVVATARKLAVLFSCMLTRYERNYAHQQPSLTRRSAAWRSRPGHRSTRAPRPGIWSTNDLIRDAELELARHAEISYKRMVQDQ